MKITSKKQYLWVEEQLRLKEAGKANGLPDRIPQMKAALSRVRLEDLPYDDAEPGQDATFTLPVSTMTDGTKAGHLKFRLKPEGMYVSLVKKGEQTVVMHAQEGAVEAFAVWLYENVEGTA